MVTLYRVDRRDATQEKFPLSVRTRVAGSTNQWFTVFLSSLKLFGHGRGQKIISGIQHTQVSAYWSSVSDLKGAKLELPKFFDLGLAKTQLALGYPPFWEGGGKQA